MNKHTCEMCNLKLDLDDGFLNIAEICDGTDQAINNYEIKNKVNLNNFWCVDCTDTTLKKIEDDSNQNLEQALDFKINKWGF